MANLIRRVSPGAWVFAFFLAVYWFTMAGWIQFGDETEKYRVAQSIVERGQISFRPTAVRNATSAGGETVSVYELGQTLLLVPLYALSKGLGAFFPTPDPNWLGQLGVGLLNPWLTALLGALFFATCRALGYRESVALALTGVFGLGTIVFPYARGYTREPLLTFLTLAAFYAAWQFRQTRRARWILVASFATGYLAFSKFIHAFVMPLTLAYILLVIWHEHRRAGARGRVLAAALARGAGVFLLPAFAFLIAQGAYSFARFGTPFAGAGAKTNPVEWILYVMSGGKPDVAIPALLVSPEKSVLLYSPPIILGLGAWFAFARRHPGEALWFLALSVIQVLAVIVRLDWHGGAWWGPRYLVQMTPFWILPLGVLLETPNRRWKKIWTLALGVLCAVSLPIQIIGAFSNDRDFLDLYGTPSALFGQIDLLAHGAFDSLVLALTPAGLQINPFGVLLLGVALASGAALTWRWRNPTAPVAGRASAWVIGIVCALEVAGFIAWIVAPYPRVFAAKGTTRLIAAQNFLAEGRTCEATTLTLMALHRQTPAQDAAVAQIERLLPRAAGTLVPLADLKMWSDEPAGTRAEFDPGVSVAGDAALRYTAPPGTNVSVATTSQPVRVRANTQYELAGWLKTENAYGAMYGVVAVYEDNGEWGNSRTTDVAKLDETAGWRPFRFAFTTLPTTRRVMINGGLYQTFGALWVDGLTLTQVDPNAPPATRVPCREYRAIW